MNMRRPFLPGTRSLAGWRRRAAGRPEVIGRRARVFVCLGRGVGRVSLRDAWAARRPDDPP